MNPNELPSVPPLPEGIGEPVFNEPWEASAFAIAVSLNQAGLFSWNEWVECLSSEIKEAETAHHEIGRRPLLPYVVCCLGKTDCCQEGSRQEVY